MSKMPERKRHGKGNVSKTKETMYNLTNYEKLFCNSSITSHWLKKDVNMSHLMLFRFEKWSTLGTKIWVSGN